MAEKCSNREVCIRAAFVRFVNSERQRRWQAIDLALEGIGEVCLSSAERDEVDLSAAVGLLPFHDDDSETIPEPSQRPERGLYGGQAPDDGDDDDADIADLLSRTDCPRGGCE